MHETWGRRQGDPVLNGRDFWNPVIATRTLIYDDRDNVTLTRAEVEGLLKLARYEKRTP